MPARMLDLLPRFLYVPSLLLVGPVRAENASSADRLLLLYDSPAKVWQQECLPIGNGHLGCMIYGGVAKEHIQFNEDSLWIGDEVDTGAYQAFGDLFIELNDTEGLPRPGISNPSGHATSASQPVEKSADGEVGTKWCMEHGGRAVSWQATFPEPPEQPLQSYSFTSADDVPGRDPRKWQLEGSNDGRNWTLLDEQDIVEPFAQRHMKKTFSFENDTSFTAYRFTFEPLHPSHFQVAEIALGDLDDSLPVGVPEKIPYRRELDINRALHTISYQKDGIRYRREYFASNPADVLVFRLTADRKGAYSGTITLTDAHKGRIVAKGNTLSCAGSPSGTIKLKDKNNRPVPNYPIRLNYEAQVLVLNEGGTVQAADGKIRFEGCDSLTLMLSADTDYLNRRDKGWKREHPHREVAERLAKASSRSYDELLREHIADYQALFDRVSLDLGDSADAVHARNTLERLTAYRGAKMDLGKGKNYGKGPLNLEGGKPDPDLEELIFQVARYLMISSSRPGCLPANLQGLWNESNNPPWRSDYHSDVNIQMNYWFVDAANLSECFTPLSEWLWSVVPVKREATRETFGVRGWAHRSENGIFGGASYHWVPGDAAWIMQNIWDHYAFTRDRQYLETRAYPLLKELCEFWEDSLVEWPDGKLVSPESISPEHGPKAEGNSYEQQLVYDLFTNYIEASEVLGEDEDFRAKVESMRARLLGPQIGKWGQLQEWAVDRDDPNNTHRHLSHLLAVQPCRQISPVTTPELAEAARVSLNARGDGGTGWSKAWKISMWARLQDGNRAYKLLQEQIHGNFYQNLLSFHPPFQIDANFGYAAGVCEMLLQSHNGEIHLLPALPEAWPDGEVTGLRARGGFEVDIAWADGKLVSVAVRSHTGKGGAVRYGDKLVALELQPGQSVDLAGSDF